MTDKPINNSGNQDNAPQRRERDTATFTPYYWEAYNEIVQPRRFDHYLILKWLPELGPVGFSLIKTLRDRCYHNRETGVLRDSCEINLNELATSIGVSLSTLQRTMRENEALKLFIRRIRQYKMVDGKPRQEANRYQVSMDDPIHPDDYERYDELRAQKESDRDQTLPGTYFKGRDGQPANPLFQALLSGASQPASTVPKPATSYDGQIDHHRKSTNNPQISLAYDGQIDHHSETPGSEAVKRFNSQDEKTAHLSKYYDGQIDHHRGSYDGQIDLADTTCPLGQIDLAETTSLGGQIDHRIKKELPFGEFITKELNTPEAGEQNPPINPPRGRGEEREEVVRGPWSVVRDGEPPTLASAAYDGHASSQPTTDHGPRTTVVWGGVLAILAEQVQSGEINQPTWHGHLTRLQLAALNEVSPGGEGEPNAAYDGQGSSSRTLHPEGTRPGPQTPNLEAVIAAPSSFTRDWVEKRHADRLRAALAMALSRPIETITVTIIGPVKASGEPTQG